MQNILLAVAQWIVNTFLKLASIKFAVLSALYVLVAWVVDKLLSIIDLSFFDNFSQVLANIPTPMLYFLGLFRFDYGLPLMMTALFARFVLRRIPVIG